MQRFPFVAGRLGRGICAPVLALAFITAACGGDEDCTVTDSCPNQPPEVTISSPDDGSGTVVGAAVTFTGSATDPEDGTVTGQSLVWTSDLDGPFGTGASFVHSDLSGGTHEITLTATDSEGASGSATISFGVGGAPLVAILSPTDQTSGAPRTVTQGTSVTFTGTAEDVEDGPLSAAAIVWTSNVDGQIGIGESFSTAALSAGMHTVTLTATDSDANEAKATVLVIVKPPNAAGYQIHIRWSEGVQLSAAQRSAVANAVTKLEAVITGDVPNLPATQFPSAPTCGGAAIPPMNEGVDDIIIYLEFVPIDGPGNTLGSAGPCFTRTGTALSLVGGMRFDSEDLEFIDSVGLLEEIVLHEMLHVLGFGIFWESFPGDPDPLPFDYLEQPSDPSNPGHTAGMTDTHFDGPMALDAFADLGGGTYTGGEIVPVENDDTEYGTGSLDGHWRESVFDEELMTTAANVGIANPLSVLTIGSLEDIGYTVDYGEADPYTQVFSIVLPDATASAVTATVDLSGDVWRGPVHAIEPDGSARRIR